MKLVLPQFLNVDLMIESDEDLSVLANEVEAGNDAYVLHFDPNMPGHLSLEAEGDHRKPETTIRALLRVLAGLSSESKELWSRANRRVFDVGYEAGKEDRGFQFNLSEKSVAAIASAKGTIAYAIYPHFEEEADFSQSSFKSKRKKSKPKK